jgi:hypothetical protein
MLLREIIGVYFEKCLKHVHALCHRMLSVLLFRVGFPGLDAS